MCQLAKKYFISEASAGDDTVPKAEISLPRVYRPLSGSKMPFYSGTLGILPSGGGFAFA
jgi:hypothetical protein